jgi:tetratricopeptide (TPR) repeat protein
MAGDAAVVAVEELAAAVEGLEERSRYEALPEETLARARELVAASRAAGRTDLEMRALLVEGDLEFRRGRTGTTGRIFREVNRWAVEHEDQAVLARSHRRLADYFTQLGNPQLALEHAVHAVEALDLVQDVPDRLRARFILTLADAYGDTGALDEARERYEQAERMSAAIDEVWWRMRVLNNRAYTEYEADDLAAADRTIRRLVRLAEEQGVDLDLHAVDTIGRCSWPPATWPTPSRPCCRRWTTSTPGASRRTAPARTRC